MRLARLYERFGLMPPRALMYFYVRRLRVDAVQELLAGVGVAIAVALVFAVTVANSSITSSASEVVHAVVGPADLQLHARGPNGFDAHVLGPVEQLPGVEHAAALLEQTAVVIAPNGQRASVTIAGTDISLAFLNGLAHTLPIGALSPGGIGLTKATARAVGVADGRTYTPAHVRVELHGRSVALKVSAILGHETAGALSQAHVAVMPLAMLQRLAGLQGRISRILVQSRHGQQRRVADELRSLARGRLTVAAATQDVSLLRQALRPSSQASDLFAGLSALLGFLFAFNAMLLTVPERRKQVIDLRLEGARRSALVQMIVFQGLCLGVVASVVGLVIGQVLSVEVFQQSPRYLTKAFTLGSSTVVGARPVVLAVLGGLLATCLASAIPLLDLRNGRPLDSVHSGSGDPRRALFAQGRLVFATVSLALVATGLFVLVPSAAIVACVALATATMLAVPIVLTVVLRLAALAANRWPRQTVLPLALSALKTTTFRSLALAATGAVALFGSVALGASRDDLLRGIDGYTSHYVSGANIWIVNPDDNQATSDFSATGNTARIARVPGVTGVRSYQGSFLDLGNRRVWVIAWPPETPPRLLDGQIIHGDLESASRRLLEGGSVAVADQIAHEQHRSVGNTLNIPTPTGPLRLTIAATTTNFGWSPGVILMNRNDYQRAWGTTAPSALGVNLAPGANAAGARREIEQALGADNGLEVVTAHQRESTIEASASEGLGQLGEISALLVAAAILAMAAAIGSSIWRGRLHQAEMRLEGASSRQVRLVLLVESALMLSAGCLTGAIAGIYGQAVIDGYLKHVTGFPVAGMGAGLRPVEIFAVVVLGALAIVAIPGVLASRVSPALALNE